MHCLDNLHELGGLLRRRQLLVRDLVNDTDNLLAVARPGEVLNDGCRPAEATRTTNKNLNVFDLDFAKPGNDLFLRNTVVEWDVFSSRWPSGATGSSCFSGGSLPPHP